jgi:hypothetical protein
VLEPPTASVNVPVGLPRRGKDAVRALSTLEPQTAISFRYRLQ